MSLLGNILWVLLGGFILALEWFVIGILWSITIIGLPIGKQCFKIAGLSLLPFGKKVVYSNENISFLLNILWLIFGGIPLVISHLVIGVILTITIIGIPFGKQHFKLAKLSLCPLVQKYTHKLK